MAGSTWNGTWEDPRKSSKRVLGPAFRRMPDPKFGFHICHYIIFAIDASYASQTQIHGGIFTVDDTLRSWRKN